MEKYQIRYHERAIPQALLDELKQVATIDQVKGRHVQVKADRATVDRFVAAHPGFVASVVRTPVNPEKKRLARLLGKDPD